MKKPGWLRPGELGVLAALALVLAAFLLWPKRSGAQVILARGGEELGRYALDEPVRVPVQGVNGFSLTLVVEEGRAHVEDSTCPDLICQHHAPVSKEGEAIICLPGQVTVTVEGGERLAQDALAG